VVFGKKAEVGFEPTNNGFAIDHGDTPKSPEITGFHGILGCPDAFANLRRLSRFFA